MASLRYSSLMQRTTQTCSARLRPMCTACSPRRCRTSVGVAMRGSRGRTSASRNDSSTALIAPGLEAARKRPAHQRSARAWPTRLGAKVAISAGPPQSRMSRRSQGRIARASGRTGSRASSSPWPASRKAPVRPAARDAWRRSGCSPDHPPTPRSAAPAGSRPHPWRSRYPRTLKPKLAPHQHREVVRTVHVDEMSLRALAHHYHVGHSSISGAMDWASIRMARSQSMDRASPGSGYVTWVPANGSRFYPKAAFRLHGAGCLRSGPWVRSRCDSRDATVQDNTGGVRKRGLWKG
jgi:hypothetical protein